MANANVGDALRKWRDWSSGNVDELAAVGTAFVWSLGLEPLPETTASSEINRRTIRYYISSELMDPPEGERRLATYHYRHLLQLLYIKARQHTGDRLGDIRRELAGPTGDELESLVIGALPASVPAPVPDDPTEFGRPANLNNVLRRWAYLTGREGRYRSPVADTRELNVRAESPYSHATMEGPDISFRVEIGLGDDISLTLPADHPLVQDEDGRALILRGIQRLIRDYRHGGGRAGEEQ